MQILIIKMSALGDILQSFPVSAYLKKKFPNSTVDWVVERKFASLVRSNPFIDEVLSIDSKKLKGEIIPFTKSIRKKKYDLIFDLQGNCKSGLMCLLAKGGEKVGFQRKEIAEWPNLLVTSKKVKIDPSLPMKGRYISLLKGYLKDSEPYEETQILLEEKGNLPFSLKDRILIAPFSKWESKELPLDFIRHLLERLEKKGYHFCLIYQGPEEELKAINIIEGLSNTILLGNRSLAEIQKGAKEALGAICADSALLHLFSLAGVPLFSLFGPSSGLLYSSNGTKDAFIQGACPYLQTFEKRCSLLRSCKDAPCLRKLPKEPTLISIENWLSRLILS